MSNKWAEHDLDIQFNRASNLGWIGIFKQAAIDFNLPAEILIAIASRETNLDPKYQQMTGDGGHGHSIMQIDIGSYPEFCTSGAWKNVELAIRQGALVLQEKLLTVQEYKGIPQTDELRLAIAGYNCGAARAVKNFKAGVPIDASTTGHDYSGDTLNRAKYFAKKLGV